MRAEVADHGAQRPRNEHADPVAEVWPRCSPTQSANHLNIFNEAPQVHILATSREALGVEGEQVHRLAPLECPSEGAHLTAEEALAFPAVRLFAERATANQARFAF